MTDVPEAARQLAGRLADAFEQDRGLAEQQNDCQDRLRAANGQLWSGLHPDALGLIYDDTATVGVREGSSVIAGAMLDALRSGLPAAEVEAAVLPRLQEAHWAIHRAFSEHQRVGEDRRHLAAEIGELIAQFVAELVAPAGQRSRRATPTCTSSPLWSRDDRHQATVLVDVAAPAAGGPGRGRGDRASE